MNADNAFFTRAANGTGVECGGLDFGSYGAHNLLLMLGGCLGAAENPYYLANYENLIRLFCEELGERCGIHPDCNPCILYV